MSVILVIDEDTAYRNGIRDVIEAGISQCSVIEASTLEHLEANNGLDLVLIDSDSLKRNLADQLRQVPSSSPRTNFALMSRSHTRSDVLEWLSVGFHGFIDKRDPAEEQLVAINELLSGRMYVPRRLEDDAEVQEAPVAQYDKRKLTRRQNEILPLLAQGMSNREIAKHFGLAPGMTKIHTAALLRALQAHNRTGAAFVAAKLVRSGASERYDTGRAPEPNNPVSDFARQPAKPGGSSTHIALPADRSACIPKENCKTRFAAVIPWLRFQDWSCWQQIDPTIGDYDSWLKHTSEVIAQTQSVGIAVEAITVDPRIFLEWCVKANQGNGSKGRSAFAAAQMLNKDTSSRSRLS